jgi:hypothetical protein
MLRGTTDPPLSFFLAAHMCDFLEHVIDRAYVDYVGGGKFVPELPA